MMYRKNLTYLLSSFILISFLISCEGATDYEYFIINNSEQEIKIEGKVTNGYLGIQDDKFKIILNKGQKKSIYKVNGTRGGSKYELANPFQDFEELGFTVVATNKTFTIDKSSVKNWYSEIQEGSFGSAYDQKYYLEIRNDHLPK